MTQKEAYDVFGAIKLDGFPATKLGLIRKAWDVLFPGRLMPGYVDDYTGRETLDLAEAVRIALEEHTIK